MIWALADATLKNISSLESLAQVVTPPTVADTSQAPAASTVLLALRNLANQPQPFIHLLELAHYVLREAPLADQSLAEETNLALSMAPWATTHPQAQPIVQSIKSILAQSGSASSGGRRSPAKKLSSLPDTAPPEAIDRFALVQAKGPSPAVSLLLAHLVCLMSYTNLF